MAEINRIKSSSAWTTGATPPVTTRPGKTLGFLG
jgi:hypothetical protein